MHHVSGFTPGLRCFKYEPLQKRAMLACWTKIVLAMYCMNFSTRNVIFCLVKIQNSRHFWGGENFLKIAKSTFLSYPVGRKFRRNRSISHGLGDMSTFVFFSIQNSQLLIYLIITHSSMKQFPQKQSHTSY